MVVMNGYASRDRIGRQGHVMLPGRWTAVRAFRTHSSCFFFFFFLLLSYFSPQVTRAVMRHGLPTWVFCALGRHCRYTR
ncbi:hypothetical protein LZ32DRAFT_130477 [Colletotrichum eremochloae]|nr:hypothetical protein LZ32DRAFT_130477 [Colletotrichum eremochloae]